MLHFEEAYPELSVLLALSDKETVRLLGVVLDGFGYQPIECQDSDVFYEKLLITKPFAALVDMQLEQSKDLCKMVTEHGGIQLIVLLPENESDPSMQMENLHANAWASSCASPETLLTNLRKLVNPERE